MPERAVDPITLTLASGEQIPLLLTPGAMRRSCRLMGCKMEDFSTKLNEDRLDAGLKFIYACTPREIRDRWDEEDFADQYGIEDVSTLSAKLLEDHTADPRKASPPKRRAKRGTGSTSGPSPDSTSASPKTNSGSVSPSANSAR